MISRSVEVKSNAFQIDTKSRLTNQQGCKSIYWQYQSAATCNDQMRKTYGETYISFVQIT